MQYDLPRANVVLSALPRDDYVRLEPQLSRAALERGQVLCGAERTPPYAYFPTTAVIAHLCTTANGDTMDVAITGCDGLVGFNGCNGVGCGCPRSVVQYAGMAWRLPLPVLREEFARGGALQQLVLAHSQLLMAQMAQTALCTRLHRLDQQLCRWILATLDRHGTDRLDATQQQVAAMLGVRREGVSAAVRRLQDAGILYWGRGRLRVLDRAGLEAHACECYQILRDASRRLTELTRRAS